MFKKILFLSFFPALSFAEWVLENPAKGFTESGISAVSGWHCTANEIEIRIDGKSYGLAGSRTQRPDTKKVCGHTDTGFSLLFNYGELSEGIHKVAVYADGELLTKRTFNSLKSGGDNFVRGLSKTIKIPGFPNAEGEATLSWSTSKQSFTVTKVDVESYDKSSVIQTFNNANGSGKFEGRSKGFQSTGYGFGDDSDHTTFSFDINDSTFKLKTSGLYSGICEYEGTYSVVADTINTSGTYVCDKFTNGTYSAKGLKVSPDGIYNGKFLMHEQDGQVITDFHTGL